MDTNARELKKIVPINIREFDERSDEVYEKLKPELEEKYHGLIVAIKPYSGDHFVGKNVIEAGDKGKEKYPDQPRIAVSIFGNRGEITIDAVI